MRSNVTSELQVAVDITNIGFCYIEDIQIIFKTGHINLLSFRRKKVKTYDLTIKILNKQCNDVTFLHSRSFGVSETRDFPIKNSDTSLSHVEHTRLINQNRLLILLQIIMVLYTTLAKHLSSLSSGKGTKGAAVYGGKDVKERRWLLILV
jgi:hypothetical protein